MIFVQVLFYVGKSVFFQNTFANVLAHAGKIRQSHQGFETLQCSVLQFEEFEDGSNELERLGTKLSEYYFAGNFNVHVDQEKHSLDWW